MVNKINDLFLAVENESLKLIRMDDFSNKCKLNKNLMTLEVSAL